MGAETEKRRGAVQAKASGPKQLAREPAERSAGNQAVQQLLRSRAPQTKLEVSEPGDPCEREADRMARQVAGVARRAERSCAVTDKIQPTRTGTEGVGRHAPAPVVRSPAGQGDLPPHQPASPASEFGSGLPSGGGSPLPADTRAFMERQFGHDFGAVRLHSGNEAAQMNRELGAQAFTYGQDIYLGDGVPDLQSIAGKQLLAHELTHTIQQGGQGGLPGGGHLIQRQALTAPASTRGEVTTLDPIVISNDPATQQRLQAQSDQMMGRFPEVWRGFCRDWYDANLAALASVPDLPNPYEAGNFWKALAGNLLWAATSITVVGAVPRAAATVVIGASVLGAGAGTGVFQTAAPPSGRAAIARALAHERDRIERTGARSLFADVAAHCIDASVTDRDAQDRLLWRAFSASISFEERANTMLVNAQNKLTSWLSQYQAQYLEWKERDDVAAKARDYELGEIAYEPFGSPFTAIADLIGIGTPADRFFEYAMRDIPLTLVFAG